MAAILRILSMSFIRPGSEIYANENSSYGIATLRPRHVSVKANRITFEFPGKDYNPSTVDEDVRDGILAVHQSLHDAQFDFAGDGCPEPFAVGLEVGRAKVASQLRHACR